MGALVAGLAGLRSGPRRDEGAWPAGTVCRDCRSPADARAAVGRVPVNAPGTDPWDCPVAQKDAGHELAECFPARLFRAVQYSLIVVPNGGFGLGLASSGTAQKTGKRGFCSGKAP